VWAEKERLAAKRDVEEGNRLREALAQPVDVYLGPDKPLATSVRFDAVVHLGGKKYYRFVVFHSSEGKELTSGFVLIDPVQIVAIRSSLPGSR
jgi:hypothetical protein